ncbi:MAG: glycosyltransferase family 4 protein [Bacteroidota bacterium]|nr:glycosyltransferase family 4 protein [Bacteroidota bacterium]
MKIATVVIDFNKQGGIERAAYELTRNFIHSGEDVTVFSSSFQNLDYQIAKVRVPAWAFKTSTKLLSFRYNFQRYIKNNKFDIIHSHAANIKKCDVLTVQSCHKAGMEIRQQLSKHFLSNKNLHIADTIRLHVEKLSFTKGNYKKIIAVSNGLKKEICEYYNVPPEDIVVIPNGVNLQEFQSITEEEKILKRKELGFSKDDFVLLFVGNEFDRKGLELVIKAMDLIKHKNVNLLVVGKDNPKPYYELSTKLNLGNRIFFKGLQSPLTQYYNASDIFVLPTYHESFLIAGMEAAACGLPLLITKVPGVEDYLKDGSNGYFINRDADDIANKIVKLIDSNSLRKQFSYDAINSAKNYSWENISEKTLSLYNE